jgi:hypothetical protein
MGHRLLIVLAAAVIGGAAGCAGRLPGDVQLTRGFASPGTPYGDALQHNTRYGELYKGFDTVAKGWATQRTPELRAALAEASIEAYHLEGDAALALRQEARDSGARGREFHLALYMPKRQWNDLEDAQSLWRAHLEVAGGDRLAPTEITVPTKTDKTPVEYPYVSPWTREYTILFPALEGEGLGRSSLVLTGPLGTLRFEF